MNTAGDPQGTSRRWCSARLEPLLRERSRRRRESSPTASPGVEREADCQERHDRAVSEQDCPERVERALCLDREGRPAHCDDRVSHADDVEAEEGSLVGDRVARRESHLRDHEENRESEQECDANVLHHSVGPPLVPIDGRGMRRIYMQFTSSTFSGQIRTEKLKSYDIIEFISMTSATYYIQGMHCDGCVKKLSKAILELTGVESVMIDLKSKKALITSTDGLSRQTLAEKVENAGHYTLVDNLGILFQIKTKLVLYFPLIVVFALIIVWTVIHQWLTGFSLHYAMHDFMASFFLIFGALKIINWKNFAEGFRAYDPLARKSRTYAYIYPLIEVGLGVAYQLHAQPELLFNAIAVIILSANSWGVIQSLSKKDEIKCACLGGFFNIPISWVTVAENVLMIAMAIYMQIVFGNI